MPSSSSSQIEIKIKENLEKCDLTRKHCAYCGLKESYDEDTSHQRSLILGRCYGCQMCYYCSQEHQHLDWLDNHMPKCAELEWVGLCELVQSIPINLSLTTPNMLWPSDLPVTTWTHWFEIRSDLVESIRRLAKSIDTELFQINKNNVCPNNKLSRREPSLNDLVDGLLAKITDSMSYSLTIGNALQKIASCPIMIKPICIHILYPPNELIEDLVHLFLQNLNESETEIKLERCEIDLVMKKKFNELLNMFPSSRFGIEIVFISTNPVVDSSQFDYLNSREGQSILIDWSKLLNSPLMKKDVGFVLNKKCLFISAWQGSYSNYIKYACSNLDGYLEPDLVVSFHPNFTKSPQKLIEDWTDDLKVILTMSMPCMFTFCDREEKEKALSILNAFQTNVVTSQSNQFSSLLLKQSELEPNQVYAKNAFYVIIKGFKHEVNQNQNQNDLRIVKVLNEQKIYSGNEALKRSKSIHDMFSNHQYLSLQNTHQIQTDACIQTMGLNEPENPSLIHINGKLQIAKSTNISIHQRKQNIIYKSTDNLTLSRANQNTLNMIDILIDNNTSQTAPLIPPLDYTTCTHQGFRPSNFIRSQPHLAILTQIDDIKLNYSSRLKLSPRPDTKTRYYQPRQLVRPGHTQTESEDSTSIKSPSTTDYQEESSINTLQAPCVQTRTRKSSISSSVIPTTFSLPTQDSFCTQAPNTKPRITNAGEDTLKNIPFTKPHNNYQSLESDSVKPTPESSTETPKPRLKKFNNSNEIPLPKPLPRNSARIDSSENESEQQVAVKSVKSVKSSLRNEIESLSASSSSSNISSSVSSSTRSSTQISSSISPHEQTSSTSSSFTLSSNQSNGFVSQMKNIFESPSKKNEFCNKSNKILNIYETPPPLPKIPPPLSPVISSVQCSPFKQPLKTTESLVTKLIAESDETNDGSKQQKQQKQRLMSNTSSSFNYHTKQADFRFLATNSNQSERSITPSSKSLNSLLNSTSTGQNCFIRHIPDSVDEVKLEYEGQRHVVVPGYMTSADILRNLLLNSQQSNEIKSIHCNSNQNDSLTLKERLIMNQQKSVDNYQEDDEFLLKKFSTRSRTRSMSGVMTLDLTNTNTTQIIDIDFDTDEPIESQEVTKQTEHTEQFIIEHTQVPCKPPRTFQNPNFTDSSFSTINQQQTKLDSIRTNSNRSFGNPKRAVNQKLSVTGSFDPNDFDSFDEDEQGEVIDVQVEVQDEEFHLPLESIDKIREDGSIKQEMNLVQFDPDDFDSFDEEEIEPPKTLNRELPVVNSYRTNRNKLEAVFNNKINTNINKSPKKTNSPEFPVKQEEETHQSNFLRSAFDRISTRSKVKSARSSSVPQRALVGSELKLVDDENTKKSKPNVKTLNLMNKMQVELDEKQKRKKLRREQKLEEERKKYDVSPKTPNEQRKFLSSIINTLFSPKENHEPFQPSLVKNEQKRLSLRRIKAKDKHKKDGLDYSQDYDTKSEINYQSDSGDFTQSSRSNPNLNLDMERKNDDLELKLSLLNQAHLNGKIKNEVLVDKKESLIRNKKEDLMKQLKAELDEEIKDRKMIELKESIINGSATTKRPTRQRSTRNEDSNRKIRSKSVTFLDEFSNDEFEFESNSNFSPLRKSNDDVLNELSKNCDFEIESASDELNPLITPSSTRKSNLSLKAGDARLFAGALTGVGPIRSIMKKSSNDLIEADLPRIQLSCISQNETLVDEIDNGFRNTSVMVKSQTMPNFRKRDKMLHQSDL